MESMASFWSIYIYISDILITSVRNQGLTKETNRIPRQNDTVSRSFFSY